MTTLAFSLFAAVTYTTNEVEKTLYVNVSEAYVYLDASVAAALNANIVTNFEKTGAGSIFVTNSLADYEGLITISEGFYRTQPLASGINYTCGKPNRGGVVIKNGATFRYDSSVGTSWSVSDCLPKTIYFEGNGVDGTYGAIYVNGGYNILGNIIGTNLVMRGDAMINVSRNGVFVGVPGNGAKLDMNGHTLTYKSGYSSSVSSAYVNINNSGKTELLSRAGDVIVQGAGIDLSGDATWLSGGGTDGGRDLIVDTNSWISLNGPGNYIKHRMVMRPGSRIHLNDGRYYYSGNYLKGGVVLDDPDNRTTISGGSGYYLNCYSLVSGNGFYVNGCRLLFNNKEQDPNVMREPDKVNTFTNGIVAVNGAIVCQLWGSALGPTNKFVELNHSKMLFADGLTYKLPEIIVNGTCELNGRFDYNYITPSGTPEDSMHFPYLTLGTNCVVACYTNMVVNHLKGLGDLTAKTKLNCSQINVESKNWHATNQWVSAFKVTDDWTIDPKQALGGAVLKVNGKIDLVSGMKIKVLTSYGVPVPNKVMKIAEASQVINGIDGETFTSDDGRWKVTKGDDGKSIYLTFTPPGISIFLK